MENNPALPKYKLETLPMTSDKEVIFIFSPFLQLRGRKMMNLFTKLLKHFQRDQDSIQIESPAHI